jgi:hypothetical protein
MLEDIRVIARMECVSITEHWKPAGPQSLILLRRTKRGCGLPSAQSEV